MSQEIGHEKDVEREPMQRPSIAALAAAAGLIIGGVAIYAWAAINVKSERLKIEHLIKVAIKVKKIHELEQQNHALALSALREIAHVAQAETREANEAQQAAVAKMDAQLAELGKVQTLYDAERLKLENAQGQVARAKEALVERDDTETKRAEGLKDEADEELARAETIRTEVAERIEKHTGMNYVDFLVFHNAFLGRQIAPLQKEEERLDRIIRTLAKSKASPSTSSRTSGRRLRGLFGSSSSRAHSAEIERYRSKIRVLQSRRRQLESKRRTVQKAIDSLDRDVVKAYNARRR